MRMTPVEREINVKIKLSNRHENLYLFLRQSTDVASVRSKSVESLEHRRPSLHVYERQMLSQDFYELRSGRVTHTFFLKA